MAVKVVVCVEGGGVTGIYSDDKNIEVIVWDWDDKRDEPYTENEAGESTDPITVEFDNLTKDMEIIY